MNNFKEVSTPLHGNLKRECTEIHEQMTCATD